MGAMGFAQREDGLSPVIAKIAATELGVNDHGLFALDIMFDYGSAGSQGLGGVVLDEPYRDNNGAFLCRRGSALGCHLLMRVLEACGGGRWETLVGRTVIALRDDDGRVVGIAPLPTEKGREVLFPPLRMEEWAE